MDSHESNPLVPLVLRLTLAGIFIYHGMLKINDAGNEWGKAWATNRWAEQAKAPAAVLEQLEQINDSVNPDEIASIREKLQAMYGDKDATVPGALSQPGVQMVVAWGELVAGIAMLLGLFTRLAALGLIAIQAGAIAMVTHKEISLAAGGGYEYNLALIAMCLALLLLGGGALSLDRCLFGRRDGSQPSASK